MRGFAWGLFLFGLCVLISASLSSPPPRLYQDQAAIQGNIYYWSLQDVNGFGSCTATDDFANIPGGKYLPVKHMYVEAEFETISADPSSYSDDTGYYYVKKSALTGGQTYTINLELRAKTILNTRNTILGARDTVGTVFEYSFDAYAANLETKSFKVRAGETTTYDVYIGGPKNNTVGASNEDLEDLISIWISQDLRAYYQKLLRWAPKPGDMIWDTYILYPDDSSKYYENWGPPATGHITLEPEPLFPSQIVARHGYCRHDLIHKAWESLQATLRHEYSHQVMHMVFGFMPSGDTGKHAPNMCSSPESAWTEGWAEFLPTAVKEWPTIGGARGSEHIEYNYNPYTSAPGAWLVIDAPFDPDYPPDTGLGGLAWHYNLSNSCSQFENSEGEVAAVLWDIFDPEGWEYLDRAYQPGEPETGTAVRPPEGWKRPLRWYDSLYDGALSDLWAVFRKGSTSLSGNNGLDKSSFVYKWMDMYSNNPKLVHGLKAILYNRRIVTELKPERPPVISNLRFDQASRTVTVTLSDPDPEDQRLLYYNVCYRKTTAEDCRYFFDEDQPVGGKQDGSNTSQFNVPRGKLGRQMVLLVHDNMLPVFETFETDLPGSRDSLSLNRVTSLPTSFAAAVALDGNTAYLADMEDGLYIYDVSDPTAPRQLGVFRNGWALGVTVAGNTAYVGDQMVIHAVDVSNPTIPRDLGVTPLSHIPDLEITAPRLWISNGILYAATDRESLLAFRLPD